MHVRIAWEIYYHQAKQNPEKTGTGPSLSAAGGKSSASSTSSSSSVTDMLRPPTHMFPSSAAAAAAAAAANALPRPHELPPTPGYPAGLSGRTPFDTAPLAAGFLTAPTSHLGKRNGKTIIGVLL